MIVRTWHGCVPLEHASAFAQHLQKTGVEHAQSIEGHLHSFVRQENQANFAHFFLATYWSSLEAIKQFAGEQYFIAVTYPDDEQFELISDPYVFHHEVTHLMPIDA
ncbi:hypothetical protein [Neisseria sp. Ec49-e6-T10]|uniref:hypothetical protein n=1 Tax=Neisseria sp. Ec49-e6-T10 TaxID=3140744 RepID=UPI003EB73939